MESTENINVFRMPDGRTRSVVGDPQGKWYEVGVGDNDTDATAHLVLDIASRATQQGIEEDQAEFLDLILEVTEKWQRRWRTDHIFGGGE